MIDGVYFTKDGETCLEILNNVSNCEQTSVSMEWLSRKLLPDLVDFHNKCLSWSVFIKYGVTELYNLFIFWGMFGKKNDNTNEYGDRG